MGDPGDICFFATFNLEIAMHPFESARNPQNDEHSQLPLPPTPGRIFRVTAGLDDWTPKEREWLKLHPELIAYQDQLQATLESVHKKLEAQRDAQDTFSVATGPFDKDCWGV